MSLLHWWPLNYSFKDQGTQKSTATISNYSPVTGKVTSVCYGLSNATGGLVFSWSNALSSFHPVSITGWYNLTASSTYNPLFTYGDSATSGLCIRGSRLERGDGTNNYDEDIGLNVTVNKWQHIAVVYDGTNITTYQNGELVDQRAGPANGIGNNNTKIRLGAFWASDSSSTAVNDFRIYNHALSAKEVKEIAKGLILHYKFNFEDLYTPIEYVECTNTQYIDTNFAPGNSFKIELKAALTNVSDNPVIHIYTAEGGNSFGIYAYNNAWHNGMAGATGGTATANTIYNLVYECENGLQKLTANGVQQFSSSITYSTLNPNNLTFLLPGYNRIGTHQSYGGYCKIYRCKIWAGDELVRDFIPCIDNYYAVPGLYDIITSTFYTSTNTFIKQNDFIPALGFTDNSGYGHNCIITAAISDTNDTACGQTSLIFNGNTLLKYTAGLPVNTKTVVFWYKGTIPSDSRIIFADSESKLGAGFYNNGKFICSANGDYQPVYSLQAIYKNNDWNHIAVVRPEAGGSVVVYVNGLALTSTGATDNWTHNNGLFIGGRSSSGSNVTGQIADFKVYAKELSLSEILDEYEAKAYIDKNNNLYCNSFIEESNEIILPTKTSLIKTQSFEEFTNPEKDKKLRYLESSGTQYIDTGVNSSPDMKIEIKVRLISENNTDKILIGGRATSSNRFWIDFDGSSSQKRLFNGLGMYYEWLNPYEVGKDYTLIMDAKNNKGYINGIEYSLNNTYDASTPARLYLFAANNQGSVGFGGNFRVYYCKIWKNDTLVRYFIPDFVAGSSGMYDLVSKGYFANQGSGGWGILNYVSTVELRKENEIYAKQLIEG